MRRVAVVVGLAASFVGGAVAGSVLLICWAMTGAHKRSQARMLDSRR